MFAFFSLIVGAAKTQTFVLGVKHHPRAATVSTIFLIKWKVFVRILSFQTFFSIPEGTLPWQPILGKIGELTFNTLAFRNGFEYSKSDLQLLNGNTFVTFYANLIKVALVTPEFTRGETVSFGTRRQKLAYLTEYLHHIISFGRHMYGDY